MDPSKNIAMYCPVCGFVSFWDKDVLGNPIIPEGFEDGKCNICHNKMNQVEENFEDFYIKGKCLDDELYFNSRYIIENYILNNPKYNSDTHKAWLIDSIEKCLDSGRLPKSMMFELRYFFNIDMTTRRPKPMKVDDQWSDSNQVRCPKCKSTSITTQKKGFGVGKAAAGVLTVGLAGALAGGIGSNKIYNVCQNCGHKWEPGK